MVESAHTLKWQDVILQAEAEDTARLRKSVIDEEFGGDPDKYNHAITLGRAHTLDWNQLVTSFEHLPELEEECKGEILWRLGYEPNDACLLPHLPFMARLLDNFRNGRIYKTDFDAQFIEHVRHVRNEDMHRSGWAYFMQPKPEQLWLYESENLAYREAARARLVRFLGYEPTLAASLEAELAMRGYMARAIVPIKDKLAQFDVRMIVVIKYREIMLEGGKAAADASPLFDWMSLHNKGL